MHGRGFVKRATMTANTPCFLQAFHEWIKEWGFWAVIVRDENPLWSPSSRGARGRDGSCCSHRNNAE